jgi:hypothetical protein
MPAFERMDRHFAAGLEKVVVPGAGHFVHLERPAEVNPRIVVSEKMIPDYRPSRDDAPGESASSWSFLLERVSSGRVL